MVNEDSDLYRAHPDWAIRIPGKKPVRSRNQLLLDFSRKEVRDCVFDQICAVLDQGKIDYVKWDMNRSMADVYAGNLSYDYVLGVYDFLEHLCSRYPDLLLEGCSGGGGRFDAGMLYYSPTDLVQRQYRCDQPHKNPVRNFVFYPVSAMGGACFGGAKSPDRTGDKFPHPRGDGDGRNFRLRIKPGTLSDEEKTADPGADQNVQEV